jgi:hypothetical protein
VTGLASSRQNSQICDRRIPAQFHVTTRSPYGRDANNAW